MKTPTTKLVIDCCKALVARTNNWGSWPDGEIPQCFHEYRECLRLPADEYGWWPVVEMAVMNAAVKMLVDFSDVVEPPQMLALEKRLGK